jgi:hypothetical protein
MDGQNKTATAHGVVEDAFPIGPNITIADTMLQFRGGGLANDVHLDPAHLW